jgi:hypothetical protein
MAKKGNMLGNIGKEIKESPLFYLYSLVVIAITVMFGMEASANVGMNAVTGALVVLSIDSIMRIGRATGHCWNF